MLFLMTLKELDNLYASLTLETERGFIKGIHAAFISEDISTLSLLGFLERILTDFQPEGRRICAQRGEISAQDRDIISLHGKIVAAMMLILQQTKSNVDLRAKTQLFLSYSAAIVKTKYDFAALFLDTLNYRIEETGLSWRAVKEDSLDVLCYALERGIKFDKKHSEFFSFSGNGRIECRDGRLKLCSSDVVEAGNRAFSILNDRISVITRNTREERLKASSQDDAESLSAFADTFIQTQDSFPKERPQKKTIKPGDKVGIMVTGLSEDGETILCSTVNSDEPVEGEIINEELVKGTWTRNLIPYLFDGDCIRDAIIVEKGEDYCLFSIREAYVSYARRKADEDSRNNVIMEAVVSEVKKEWYDGRITWMTPTGYGGVSLLLPDRKFKPGDKAVMSVTNIQTMGSISVFINLSAPKYGYKSIDKVFESEEDVLAQFVTSAKKIREECSTKGDENTKAKDSETLRLLASILANRATKRISLNTYKQRLVALFLLNLIGDKAFVDALIPETYYLRCCISYAQGNKVPSGNPCALSESHNTILRLLSMGTGQPHELMNLVLATPAQSVAGKIGTLLLGLNISSRFRDEFDADEDVVRKKSVHFWASENYFTRMNRRNMESMEKPKTRRSNSSHHTFFGMMTKDRT